jgi:hypothetical protein
MLVRVKPYLLAPAFFLSYPKVLKPDFWASYDTFAHHESFSAAAITLGTSSIATSVREVSIMYR